MTGAPARLASIARLAILGAAASALAACAGNVGSHHASGGGPSAATYTTTDPPEVGRSVAAAPPQVAPTAMRETRDEQPAEQMTHAAAEKTLQKAKAAGYSTVGTASWYGPRFHGRRTALGETYDMNALTAAHRTLPLPSTVRVTNLVNRRSVTLRVNDRGPYIGGRVIDVSAKAAQVLGFHDKGLARVKVDYVGPAPRALPTLATAGAGE